MRPFNENLWFYICITSTSTYFFSGILKGTNNKGQIAALLAVYSAAVRVFGHKIRGKYVATRIIDQYFRRLLYDISY